MWENNREDSEDSATQVRRGNTSQVHVVAKCSLQTNVLQVISLWVLCDAVYCECSQVVVLELRRGDQVYVELISGRKICKYLDFNIFTGHILYPYTDEQ